MILPTRRRARIPVIALTAALGLSACVGAQGVGPSATVPSGTDDVLAIDFRDD